MITQIELNRKLGRSFIERAKTQVLRGEALDKAALEFVCGAAAAVEALGVAEQNGALVALAFVISVNGARDWMETAAEGSAEHAAAFLSVFPLKSRKG